MSNKKIRIAVLGANGRMGKKLIKAIVKTKSVSLGPTIIKQNDNFFVKKNTNNLINEKYIKINSNLNEIMQEFDVLIDFTHPIAIHDYLDFCVEKEKKIIIGTTGFSKKEIHMIKNASKNTKIVFSSNFSIGINLLNKIVKKIAKKIGNFCDIDIIEKHHRNKIDSPSGTALEIGREICKTMNLNFKKSAIFFQKRDSNKRKKNTINFSSIRAGNIIGEHTVIFSDLKEIIEITHKASSRMTFAEGAVYAALWIVNQNKNGLYNMQDVLQL